MVAEKSRLEILSADGNVSSAGLFSPSSLPVAIDVTTAAERLFWSDKWSETISSSRLNGSDSKVVVRKLSAPDGLAIDWISNQLFFTDGELNAIGVSDFVGRHTIIILDDLDKPRAIAVDPEGGYIYWTEWGATPKIERSFMSGKTRETLVHTGLKWPNGLALDLIGRRIYWVDAHYNRVCVVKKEQ